jgi:hypothetical protein
MWQRRRRRWRQTATVAAGAQAAGRARRRRRRRWRYGGRWHGWRWRHVSQYGAQVTAAAAPDGSVSPVHPPPHHTRSSFLHLGVASCVGSMPLEVACWIVCVPYFSATLSVVRTPSVRCARHSYLSGRCTPKRVRCGGPAGERPMRADVGRYHGTDGCVHRADTVAAEALRASAAHRCGGATQEAQAPSIQRHRVGAYPSSSSTTSTDTSTAPALRWARVRHLVYVRC